jgi:hypothetical protein
MAIINLNECKLAAELTKDPKGAALVTNYYRSVLVPYARGSSRQEVEAKQQSFIAEARPILAGLPDSELAELGFGLQFA